GGDNYVTVAILQNTTATDFSEANFFPPYPPDGSGVTGAVTTGTAAGETLDGTFGDDSITGLGGNDTIRGGNGADTLDGGSGADQLSGGFGDDLLIGGADADTFIFGLGEGADTIQDFELGVDSLALTGGQAIASLTELDTDLSGAADTTLVTFGDASTVLLMGVTGVSDPEML
ncbi:hypothetical protein MB818_21605, partial [Ruegeria sp. 1NDH52C]|nr:hypothetical protein [Ruegeria alba]